MDQAQQMHQEGAYGQCSGFHRLKKCISYPHVLTSFKGKISKWSKSNKLRPPPAEVRFPSLFTPPPPPFPAPFKFIS